MYNAYHLLVFNDYSKVLTAVIIPSDFRFFEIALLLLIQKLTNLSTI